MYSWRKGRLKDCLERTEGVEEGQAQCTFFPDGNQSSEFCCNFSEQEQQLIDCVLIRRCSTHMLWMHVSENYALN